MGYKITIIKEETKKKTDRSYEKTADSGNDKDGGPVYGYVEFEGEERVSTPVYEQRVEELDLVGVINAVNKEQGKKETTQNAPPQN